ncbi:MAG: quinone oxidoreductase [Vicinamibacteria bacterium]
MKAIRVHQTGGPDELKLEDVPLPEPGPGQARVRLHAIGINFIDVYHRTGLYKLPLPFTPGGEGAGVVTAVGDGAGAAVGDRVAWAGGTGGYAEEAVIPADRLLPVPQGLEWDEAAAAPLQGMTAHYLATDTYRIQAGDTVLVHAAAGGVGLLLVQLAKARGARVLATVGTEEKARLAKEAGAAETILYKETDFAAAVKTLTDGRGVQAVYDSVGKTTFDGSLDCLAVRGTLALFGQSSGLVPPLDLARLAPKSLVVTRPTLWNYTVTRDELLARARDVFEWIGNGVLKLRIHRALPLAEAAAAHRMLEARETVGKLLLLP